MRRMPSWRDMHQPFSKETGIYAKRRVHALAQTLYRGGQIDGFCFVGSGSNPGFVDFTLFSDIDGLMLPTNAFDKKSFSEQAAAIARETHIPVQVTPISSQHMIDMVDAKLYQRHRQGERDVIGKDPLEHLHVTSLGLKTIARNYLLSKEEELSKDELDSKEHEWGLQVALGFSAQAAWKILPALIGEEVFANTRYFDKGQVVTLFQETLTLRGEEEMVASLASLKEQTEAYRSLVTDVATGVVKKERIYLLSVENLALRAAEEARRFITNPYWGSIGLSETYAPFKEGQPTYPQRPQYYQKER